MEHDDQSWIALAEMLRAEGVTEGDLLWWRNLSAQEKQEIKEADAAFRIPFLAECERENMPQAQALLRMMKTFAFYEEYPPRPEILNLTVKLGLAENDIALPYELHGRIDNFLTEISTSESRIADLQKEVEESSSFNAYIRQKIKRGEI
jgi:hypothetical protein